MADLHNKLVFKVADHLFLIFLICYLAATASFGPLSREQPQSTDVNDCILSIFDPKVSVKQVHVQSQQQKKKLEKGVKYFQSKQ